VHSGCRRLDGGNPSTSLASGSVRKTLAGDRPLPNQLAQDLVFNLARYAPALPVARGE
jgi:hypothetical protein